MVLIISKEFTPQGYSIEKSFFGEDLKAIYLMMGKRFRFKNHQLHNVFEIEPRDMSQFLLLRLTLNYQINNIEHSLHPSYQCTESQKPTLIPNHGPVIASTNCNRLSKSTNELTIYKTQ